MQPDKFGRALIAFLILAGWCLISGSAVLVAYTAFKAMVSKGNLTMRRKI